MACIIQYFMLARIIDRDSVIDYIYNEMYEKDSQILSQISFQVMIQYLENGEMLLIGPGKYFYWIYGNSDDKPCEKIITFVGDVFDMNGQSYKDQVVSKLKMSKKKQKKLDKMIDLHRQLKVNKIMKVQGEQTKAYKVMEYRRVLRELHDKHIMGLDIDLNPDRVGMNEDEDNAD